MSHRRTLFPFAAVVALTISAAADAARPLADVLDGESLAPRKQALALAPPAPADEIGRATVHLGVVQSGAVRLGPDCTPDPSAPLGPDDRCLVLNPLNQTTSFNYGDLGRITLPARSARSLICAVMTAQIAHGLSNTGVGNVNGIVRVRPGLVVESEVLNDPRAIDANTGLPFNGQINFGGLGGSYLLSRTLVPGADDVESRSYTRFCIGGLSQRGLVEGYGLPADLAAKFFRQPITLRLSASGQVRQSSFLDFGYGVRLFGD